MIEINCKKERCGRCKAKVKDAYDYYFCPIFKKNIEQEYDGKHIIKLRLPECLAAEVKEDGL